MLICKFSNLPDGSIVNIAVSAILFVCSIEMGIADTFSLIFGSIRYKYFCNQVQYS